MRRRGGEGREGGRGGGDESKQKVIASDLSSNSRRPEGLFIGEGVREGVCTCRSC